MAKPFSGTFAPMLCNSYNHCPCARHAHVTESWPLAGVGALGGVLARPQVLQNSGCLMFMLRVKTLSA